MIDGEDISLIFFFINKENKLGSLEGEGERLVFYRVRGGKEVLGCFFGRGRFCLGFFSRRTGDLGFGCGGGLGKECRY